MKRNLTFLLVSLLLSLSFTTQAQNDFRNGYVITNAHDTLYGLIDFKDYISNSISCHFTQSPDVSVTIFTPEDIHAYRIIDDRYFISKTVDTKDGPKVLFLEYLIKGEANIYYYRDLSGDHYLIDKADNPLREIVYRKEVIVVDHVTRLKESTRHIGILKVYLSDCPELHNRIESLKKPDHNNMISLAKEYHQKICNNDSCIIYAQKKPPVRIAAEPTIGILKYKYGEQFYLGKGVLLHVWLPRSSERLYVRTGYYHSKAILERSYNDEGVLVSKEVTLHRIPLQFEYLFPGKILQPRFSYGINLFNIEGESGNGILGTCGAGVLIKTFNKIYFSAGVDAEWTPILVSLTMDSKIENVSYSFNMGMHLRF